MSSRLGKLGEQKKCCRTFILATGMDIRSDAGGIESKKNCCVQAVIVVDYVVAHD